LHVLNNLFVTFTSTPPPDPLKGERGASGIFNHSHPYSALQALKPPRGLGVAGLLFAII